MNRRGCRPAARFAAFHVPKCSITVCGWTLASGSAANSRIVGERPRRAADARSSARISSSVYRRRRPARNSASASLVDPLERRMPSSWPGHAINTRSFSMILQVEQSDGASATLARMGARLALETSAARLVGRLSRAAGRGGGTTLPGKLVWKLDPAALDALAARLPQGVALVSATNGKTTTTAMASAILSPTRRLAWNNSGANLASGIASTLLAARRRRSRAARGRRVRAAGGDAPDAPACRVPRQPLPRPARPLRRARAHRRALARLPSPGSLPRRHARRERRRPARRRARRRPRAARCSSASTTRGARAPASSTPPTRSTAFAAVTRTATTRPTSDISAPIAARRAATHGRRSTSSRERSSRTGSTASPSSSTPGREPARPARRPRPLQRLQRARRRLARALARRRRSTTSSRGWSASGPHSGASSGSRSAIAASCCCSSRTRPARTRRCGRSRRAASPPTLVVALNDRIADGRDVSWIWDVDFEPVLERAERIVVSGERAAELGAPLHVRRIPARAARARARSRGGTRPRARADPARRRARRPPDVHRDARAARDRHRARAHAAVLGERRPR